MLRYSANPNLHLYRGETFEGLPLMNEKGPFFYEYLVRLKQTIEAALAQYPRVLAFRIDLRFPQGIDLPPEAFTNAVISRFFESLKAKIKHDRSLARERNPYAHDTRVRYFWTREVGAEGRPHYHVLILLNRDAYYTPGKVGSERPNMISRLQEAWASALGLEVRRVSGLVHVPANPTYRIDRNPQNEASSVEALFYRASYLSKAATKLYGANHHGFGSSRDRALKSF